MNFEKKDNFIKLGEKIGFIFMYFVFTTILYFILKLLNKFPSDWDYFYMLNITLFIVLIGILFKFLLK